MARVVKPKPACHCPRCPAHGPGTYTLRGWLTHEETARLLRLSHSHAVQQIVSDHALPRVLKRYRSDGKQRWHWRAYLPPYTILRVAELTRVGRAWVEALGIGAYGDGYLEWATDRRQRGHWPLPAEIQRMLEARAA